MQRFMSIFSSCLNLNDEKSTPSAQNLLKEVEEQKQVLEQDKEFESSLKKIEKSQRKILEENPEFVKMLMQLKESMGTDGEYDKAILGEILAKTRKFCDEDPRLRVFLKAQEKKIGDNAELQQKFDSLAKMKQEVLQIS